MSIWRPVGVVGKLVGAMEQRASGLGQLLSAVASKSGSNEALGDNELDRTRRRDIYLARFVAPVAELAGWPDHPPPQLVSFLGVHLQLAGVWRTLDDLLDSGYALDNRQKLVGRSVASSARAAASMKSLGLDPELLEEAIMVTCAARKHESKEALPVERIPERAAPFLVVPRILLAAHEFKVWEAYVSVVGLLHDVHDVARDLEQGIHTLPTTWLADVSPAREFRPDVFVQWWTRCADELAIATEKIEISQSGEVIKVLVDEALEYVAELRCEIVPGEQSGRVQPHRTV